MTNEDNNEEISSEDQLEAAGAELDDVMNDDGEAQADASAEIERLQNELITAQEQALRATAEAQNASRRATADIEKAHKFGQEKLIGDLLVVVDNLERSLAAIDDGGEALKPVLEGVELTLKSLVDALKRHNVEAIDPEGLPFDPQLHQAMTAIENADVEPNTVLDVFQKGYTLHGRLVRPAMVVVSKAANK
ncbi:nucleotide exchange factor GrpE [Aurantivibrio infirmus]